MTVAPQHDSTCWSDNQLRKFARTVASRIYDDKNECSVEPVTVAIAVMVGTQGDVLSTEILNSSGDRDVDVRVERGLTLASPADLQLTVLQSQCPRTRLVANISICMLSSNSTKQEAAR